VLEVEANIVLRIGVRATIGIAAAAAVSGVSNSSSTRRREASSAASNPAASPSASPTSALRPVSQVAVRIGPRFSRNCSKMALGFGSTNGSMSRSSTNTSQSRRKPTPNSSGGQRPAKMRPDQTAPVLTATPRASGRAAPRAPR
jgi:hypothetical protein